MDILTNRFVIAILVPFLLFLAGGVGKKLVRGGKDWQRKDWYLGVDASLAALSATLINFFELTRLKKLVPADASRYDRQQIASLVSLRSHFSCF